MLIKYYFKRIYCLIPYMLIIIAAPSIATKSSILSAQMMDNASGGDYSAFLHTLGIVFLLYLLHGLLLFCMEALRALLVRNARELLRKDMFICSISTFSDTFNEPDVGYSIATFSNDISILEYKYFEPWLNVLEGIFALIISASAILSLNRRLALVIIIGELCSVGICMIVKTYSAKKNRIYIGKLALFTQRIKDYFATFGTIRNYSVEKKIMDRFLNINRETESNKNDADIALCFVNSLSTICNSVLKFIVTGYGILLMVNGEITVGLIYAAYLFTNQILSPMQSIISGVNSIESVKSITNRVNRLFRIHKYAEPETEEMPSLNKGIEFRDVTVTVKDTVILNHVSHEFQLGKKYLIIGKNGSGKSTLLRLLKKSTRRFDGKIFVDGVDISNLSAKPLSKRVCYINESVSLLCDTVKQNIVLFRKINDEDLEEIIKKVGLSIPLDRVVRDGERNISSGEMRRIEIARSFVDRPKVIIYDEAISTLDIQTAYIIENMLLNLEDETIIFVSHNFSNRLIRKYDEILLMENGKIVDCGTHDELMARNSYYQKILSIKSGAVL